jgi:Na+/proline symporter
VGVLAFTASLAPIMSTADSLIIAISQLVTARRMLSIHSNQQQLVFKLRTWIGRSVSLFSTIVAVIIVLIWYEGINALAPIQFGISFQACPPFIVGLCLLLLIDVISILGIWLVELGLASLSSFPCTLGM